MALLDMLVAVPPPLRMDEDGVLRVGGTRVRFESVIGAFDQGAAAEEILLKYPSLNLTDIYAVITYYLWHRSEFDEYLSRRKNLIQQSRHEDELQFPSSGIRERLLARRAAQS